MILEKYIGQGERASISIPLEIITQEIADFIEVFVNKLFLGMGKHALVPDYSKGIFDADGFRIFSAPIGIEEFNTLRKNPIGKRLGIA